MLLFKLFLNYKNITNFQFGEDIFLFGIQLICFECIEQQRSNEVDLRCSHPCGFLDRAVVVLRRPDRSLEFVGR